MNRRIFVANFILLFALVGCEPQDQQIPVDQNVRPARIFEIQDSAATLKYEFVGRVGALQSVDMSFEVGGPLAKLLVLEGQEIQAGNTIAELDPTVFELAVRESTVQLKIAEQDLLRKQQVLAKKGIARSTVDDARSVFQLQQVRLERAKQSLADSHLVAPFDAFVAQRFVDNRIGVKAGDKIVRLHDLSRLLVIANVPEQLLATATADQIVDLYAIFNFLPDIRFPLALYENRGEVDTVSQTYKISFVMDRPSDFNLLPGMTTTVHVELRDPQHSVVSHIPASAVVSDEQGFFVWLYDESTQQVSRQTVSIGTPNSTGIPVLSGLTGGQLVVATGASQLQDGMQVRRMAQ